MQVDPDRAGSGMAVFAMVSNILTRCQVEIAAIKLAMERRGLLTQHEFASALDEINRLASDTMQEYQNAMRQHTPPPNTPQGRPTR
jgi:hypothetical protein